MKTELSKTEKSFLLKLHFTGCLGKTGSLNKKQRFEILTGLINKGFLNENCQPTNKAHNYFTTY